MALLGDTLDALRAEHDALVQLFADASEETLRRSSGAEDWPIAQVLSHLGSSAELGQRSIAGAAGRDVNQEAPERVWARWDAMSPTDQAAGFARHEAAYLETVESLSDAQRASMAITLGFLPDPVPLEMVLGMRLAEVANHSWDARVGIDPEAEVRDRSATPLIEHFAGSLGFLLAFSARADYLAHPVRLAIRGGGIVVAEGSTSVVTSLADPTATLDGPIGASIRLMSGRLRPPYDGTIRVSGNSSLDELRGVFPGY